MRENKQKQKIKLNGLFFERKFVFLQPRKENEEFWQIPTPVDKGTAEEESLKREFDRYYTPENLTAAINHPSQVVRGVRDRMMQAVGGLGILSGNSILNERISHRLTNYYHLAPEAYKHIIDEEIRRIGGPGVDVYWGRPERLRLERRVAGQFFTFDPRTTNYGALFRTINGQIRGLGRIGGNAFVDSRRRPINVGNPFATNEFDVATVTPTGLPPPVQDLTRGAETIVVRWHQDDFITIKTKLERAGVWANFSRQGNAREFIHLKFRHSLIDQVIREEAAKLSADKYNPQRLTTWLENDLTAQAFRDDLVFKTWLNDDFLPACDARRIYTATQLHQRANIDLLNQLKEQQQEARERIRANSLEAQLKKILIPNQLENVHSSKETKTMLAYLFYKLHTPKYAEKTRTFIRELAGDNTNLRNDIETINSLIEPLNPIVDGYNDTIIRITQLTGEIQGLNNQRATVNRRAPNGAEQYENLTNQITSAEKELRNVRIQLVKNILNLRKTLADNQTNTVINTLITPDIRTFINQRNLQTAPLPPDRIEDFIDRFDKLTNIFRDLKTLSDNINEQKKNKEKDLEIANKKAVETKTTKMDSRGLLYKLVEKDLSDKGVTEQTGIQQKAHLTTNLLIADCRNGEVFGEVNQKIASGLEKSGIRLTGENMLAQRFFSPVMSATDAIEHIVDTDPDLCMFKNIHLTSTRNDMLKIINRYGPVPPAKIREFTEKLAEVIRGIEVEYKPGISSRFMDWMFARKKPELVKRIRVLDEEVPCIENLIGLLTQLEAQQTTENFINEVKSTEEFEPGTDRNKLVLDMLKDQSENSQALDKSLTNALEGHKAEFKKFFNKAEINRLYNEKMDEMEGLPREEQIAELEKIGLTERVISRGFPSVKTKRRLRKGGWAALKYGPLSWPVWAAIGVGKGASWFGSYAKSVLWTEESKAKAEKVRALYRGSILEPAWKAVTWPIAIAGYAISRPKTWLKGIENRALQPSRA